MDRRAQECFALAYDDAELPDDPQLRSTLIEWFGSMIVAMAAYPRSADDVPADLPLPVRSPTR
jgi:hypothetical protein